MAKKKTKKKLNNQLKGLIARLVAKISIEDNLDVEDAFLIYADNLSPNMSKYDINTPKTELIKKAKEKVNQLQTIKKKPSPKKKGKEPSKPSKPDQSNLITLKDGREGRIVDPTSVTVKGSAKMMRTNLGTLLKATSKTKSLYIDCGEYDGVFLDEDTAGCFAESNVDYKSFQ